MFLADRRNDSLFYSKREIPTVLYWEGRVDIGLKLGDSIQHQQSQIQLLHHYPIYNYLEPTTSTPTKPSNLLKQFLALPTLQKLRGPVIGINFGFTNSSVAILEERKAKVLKNDEGSFTTPSVVSFTKNGGGEGECLVGAPALRQAVLNSQNTVFNIKRLIGRKFDDKEVQDFIVAVCNLNGGSFEYTVLELKNYNYEIVSNKYDICLSGEAFNNVIVNYFVSEFKRENGINLNKDSIAKQRLREATEKAKCELSNSTQIEIILPNIIFYNGEAKHFQINLSRSKFEELTFELTQKIVDICQPTKENINYPDISKVLLVGGMTKMPKFWEAITIYVKEFYSALHIDVRSTKAIKGLGHFAVKFIGKPVNRENIDAYCAISRAYDISREGIGWYFGGEHKDLCNDVFCFLKKFLFINKKKVWSKLKPYVIGKKLASENEKLDSDFREIEFKRISTRERQAY
uniref:Uncharacterized protein n=1 Tax=Meloidogyne javanica TaxID=6303 RepID=A0A915LSR6_MELJA